MGRECEASALSNGNHLPPHPAGAFLGVRTQAQLQSLHRSLLCESLRGKIGLQSSLSLLFFLPLRPFFSSGQREEYVTLVCFSHLYINNIFSFRLVSFSPLLGGAILSAEHFSLKFSFRFK